MALDHDRGRDRRPYARIADADTERTGRGLAIAVHPGWTAGLEHDRAEVVPAKPLSTSSGERIARAQGRDEGQCAVGLVAAQARQVDAEQMPNLSHDRREH